MTNIWMCTSESKINKKFTITTQHPTASHRISHLSFTRVPSFQNQQHQKRLFIPVFCIFLLFHFWLKKQVGKAIRKTIFSWNISILNDTSDIYRIDKMKYEWPINLWFELEKKLITLCFPRRQRSNSTRE